LLGTHGSDEVPHAVGENRISGSVPLEPGVVIQKKPDVPGFPGSRSFYPTIRDLKR